MPYHSLKVVSCKIIEYQIYAVVKPIFQVGLQSFLKTLTAVVCVYRYRSLWDDTENALAVCHIFPENDLCGLYIIR